MTNPPTDERRAAFEKWACKNGYSIEIYKRGDGSYHHGDTEDAWSGWQAALSHQGEVVELAKLEALPRCDMSSEGFHNGSSCIEYDWNPSGDWLLWSDLTALISKAEKV